MKHHIQIKFSYIVWGPSRMKRLINYEAYKAGIEVKNYTPYIVEWWLHNIGYYVTKPLTFIPALKNVNLRCRDVDLMVEGAEK